ncbi:hypothetical protein [Crenobacter intestini]|uniref:Uncharacterized protein n=1 Tax=Crenobacter intestini TaxID=2563443 RepID=A0A4T0V6Z5_9NEIS|nr:hypothetical protein [Crenobacter intestini]TIC87035.1 hypothetical protein E5K04_01050 [Crenobacter intestini]
MSAKVIRFDVDRIVRVLCAAVVALLVLSVLFEWLKMHRGAERVFGIRNFFAVDEEYNLPSVFSFLDMLFAALLLLLQARLEPAARLKRYWTGLGCVFVYLAFDELLQIHERLGPIMRAEFGVTHGVFYFAWLLAVLPLVAVFGLVYLRFLLWLPRRLAWGLVLAGAVFLCGAVGVEMFGGWYSEQYGETNLGYKLITTLEEGCEMFGVLLLVRLMLHQLAPRGAVSVDFNVAALPAPQAGTDRVASGSAAGRGPWQKRG